MACPGNLNSWTSLKFQLIKSFELLHKFHLVVLDFAVLVQLTLGSQDISFICSEMLIPYKVKCLICISVTSKTLDYIN